MSGELTKTELQKAVASIPHWYHSIDLGHDIMTPGDNSPEALSRQLQAMQLPDLHGKTVLDIGAWDGYFSWAAERLGAHRVVSLDHFVWAMDRSRATEHRIKWQTEGSTPKPYEDTDAWKPLELPGKRGYDLAHKVLKSKAECHVEDFMEVEYQTIGGPFDVVLWMGILYHMRNPLLALKKVAEATKEVAIIESVAIDYEHYPEHAMCEFFERDELSGDFTNWWAPNVKAIIGMCRSSGFDRVEVVQGPPVKAPPPPIERSFWEKLKRAGGNVLREFDLMSPLPGPPAPKITKYRIIVQAWK